MEHNRPIRVAFVLTEFIVGGAEMMLWKLLSRLDRGRFTPCVLALSGQSDVMLQRFAAANVHCRVLGISSARDVPTGLMRLAAALRKFRPDIVQGWLYHANIAATMTSVLIKRRTPVMWSIRGAPDWGPEDKWQKRLTRWAGKKLSPLPLRIVHNSVSGALAHERLGYAAARRVVVPNGFDTAVFQPSGEARQVIRRGLALSDDTLLIGVIGRYDPLKDHCNFLHAAAILQKKYAHLHYVLAGKGLDWSNPQLVRLIDGLGLRDRVHLLGLRDDVNVITAALDLSVLSSSSEGFPNVVGEAMSCGVPCIVTDVGDCAFIVGDTGKTVPPRDSHQLAGAIGELLELGEPARAMLGTRARQRIIDRFSLDAIVRQYQDLYDAVYAESISARRDHAARPSARWIAK